MGRKNMRKYKIFYCSDCDLDHFVSLRYPTRKHAYCPDCGDNAAMVLKEERSMERFYSRNRQWTIEEDRLVEYGINKGLTYQEISEELQERSPKAISTRLYYKNLLERKKNLNK